MAAVTRGGWFDVGNRRVLGELTLDGENTSVALHDPEFFFVNDDGRAFVTGLLHDLKKVSLIDCLSSGLGQRMGGGEAHRVQDLTPHYVLIGDRHLDPAERSIKQVSLLVDDAEALFPDHDAFGRARDPAAHMEALAADYAGDTDRVLRQGPAPRVYFFGGEIEIVSVETTIGRFSVQHRHRESWSQHSNDFGVKNQTWMNLEFDEAVGFETVITRTNDLLRFIEIMAGRPQNLEQMSVYAPVGDKHYFLDVDWLFRPSRTPQWEHRRVSNIDLLINPIRDRPAFEAVMKSWFNLDVERKLPRSRASHLLGKQRSFDPERLVAAANMFDLLPESALPSKPTLSQDVLKAKADAKAIFKSLPASEERTSILQALGRIGSSTLRRKIAHRAETFSGRIHPKLDHLDLVIGEAVTMRNHFVHGSPPGFDYAEYPETSSFFAEALEFIFAASDLVDAGWNIQEWISRGSTLSHPYKALVKRWEFEAGMVQKAKSAMANQEDLSQQRQDVEHTL